MKDLIKTLESKKTGYGHFYITINVDNEEVGTTTTNMLAIDAASNEDYDFEDVCGRYYRSRREAQKSLVDEILTANGYMMV